MSESSPRPQPLEPFPPHPFEEEIIEDWRWIYEERRRGRFDEFAGQHVAVLDKTVYGSSRDPILLRQYVPEKYNLNPDRLVIFGIPQEKWIRG
jgi:hypothetical protein